MLARKPYDGTSRKLVLGFDVGTTFSGVSYCLLEPGEIPVLFPVTKFPGTGRVGGDCKIPSVLYYDQSGVLQKAGAEADNIDEKEAAENGWTKAEWFKLHLCPKTLSIAQNTNKIPPLPEGKSVVQIFADFLRYLYNCTCDYIKRSKGKTTWVELEATAEIVLTHPNGWEGGQQELMRQAAIRAGVTPDTLEGQERLFFVPEGEASLHFCVQNGSMAKIQKNEGIIIIDAGGGTIDLSAYKKASEEPLSYEEIAPAECSLNGSVFITERAEGYFKKHFMGSSFESDVPRIAKIFDRQIKPLFNSATESMYIQCGKWVDNFPALNVKSGRLKVDGSNIEKFFEPAIPTIMQRIQSQLDLSETTITSVLLVGGFSNSQWLFDKLENALGPLELDLYVPENDHANKAVAHGAVSFRIDQLVTTRVARYSYGIELSIPFDPSNLQHKLRRNAVYTDVRGEKLIRGHFSDLLPKGTKVSETEEFRQSCWREARTETATNLINTAIICFRGREQAPEWLDQNQAFFKPLCVVKADLSNVRKSVDYSDYIHGHFFSVTFDVILCFGSTEFKAYIAWSENGVEKRSPAQMIYNPDPVIVDF